MTASTETVDCSHELDLVEQEKEKLADEAATADREEQEAAAKKVHLGEQQALLDKIGAANTAWEAAKGALIADAKKLCTDLATCATRISVGDDEACLTQAYTEHANKRKTVDKTISDLTYDVAVADAEVVRARGELQRALDTYNNVFAAFTTWMTTKRDQIRARQGAFAAARGEEGCDPKKAWILLKLAQESCAAFEDKQDDCLPLEMMNLLKEITTLQGTVRTKESAKAVKSTALDAAQALKAETDTDLVAAVHVGFSKCKQGSGGGSGGDCDPPAGSTTAA